MGFSVNNFSFFFSFWKYNFLWHYFRSGIGSASKKCKKKIRYSLHCSSDPSLQSVIVLQRWDAWMHFSWFAQANWSALQVTRWSKESHESWPIVDTNYIYIYIYILHYHLDCRGCVISHARAVSIANLVMIRKGSSQLTFRFFFVYIRVYIYIHIYTFF